MSARQRDGRNPTEEINVWLVLTNKETTNKRGRGAQREYYGSPSYDGHVGSVITHYFRSFF
jgi:hypothetical protein